MTLIRYPGSKEKLAQMILSRFPDEMYMPLWMDSNMWEYREPFFGAGAIGFKILERLPPSCSAWINDKDYAIACLWKAVKEDVKHLSKKIEQFRPSTEAYYKFKKDDGNGAIHPTELGFRKLALHQMSYSGLGYKSGGPIGGKDQDNAKYKIDCRWNPSMLIKKVVDLHNIFAKIPNLRITCRDFEELIDDNPKVFLYLDPPYYVQGGNLYKYDLDHIDHLRLSNLLRNARNKWLLSYDDHSAIRQFYNWAHIESVDATYTINITEVGRKNSEILIQPNGSRVCSPTSPAS